MNHRANHVTWSAIGWALCTVIWWGLVGRVLADEAAAVPPPVPEQEAPEVLNRGPVHEAFAEPVNLQPQDVLIAPREPPPAVDEEVLDRSPEKQGLTWVPGYWAWDEDDEGFIWVSGCWRAAPPGMTWVPGYWAAQGESWAWVSGYWTPVGAGKPDYLPAPPPVDGAPPPEAGIQEDSIWVPPCGYWQESAYVMRPGYWIQPVPDWVWTPAHYIWTPRGYLFAPGHWDHALEQRGVLYAPVRFGESYRFSVRPFFAPHAMLDLGLLTVSLFAYPRYSHFFYGDYYADGYSRAGIYPWFDCGSRYTWYDPVYEHARWRHRRSGSDWERDQRHEYERRRADSAPRPEKKRPAPKPRTNPLPEPPSSIGTYPVRDMTVPRISTPPVRKPVPPPAPASRSNDETIRLERRRPVVSQMPVPAPIPPANPSNWTPPSGVPRVSVPATPVRRGQGWQPPVQTVVPAPVPLPQPRVAPLRLPKTTTNDRGNGAIAPVITSIPVRASDDAPEVPAAERPARRGRGTRGGSNP